MLREVRLADRVGYSLRFGAFSLLVYSSPFETEVRRLSTI